MAGKRTSLPVPDDCPPELHCTTCKKTKPREQFPRNRSTKTTYGHHCNECNRVHAVETRLRQDLRIKGLESFRGQLDRERELIAIRVRLIHEHMAELNAIQEGKIDSLPLGSRRRAKRFESR